MDDFGRQVRERREKEGLSQEELAEKVGLSRNYVSQIERGVSMNLSFTVRRRLSEALGLPVEEARGVPERLPQGLAEFVAEAHLPPKDVAMLARIEYRGQQPRTIEQWRVIYQTIRAMSDQR